MSSLFESLGSMPQPQLMQQIQAPVQQPTTAQPQQQITQPDTTAPSTTGTTQPLSFKSRLQEYAQKAAIPVPLYRTINEGLLHAPLFRSTVEVDGRSYTSPNVFSHRRAAEADVARIAIENLTVKTREENCALIRQDTMFCKAILNEFAVKIRVEKPVYKTEKEDGLIPLFVSSLAFNGNQYVGYKGTSKKESQQLAARAVILSILDSDARSVISEIIKSKRVLYAAMDKVKYSCNAQNGAMPLGIQAEPNVGTNASQGKEKKRKRKNKEGHKLQQCQSNQTSTCVAAQ